MIVKKIFLLLAAALAALSFVQPWGGFSDPDAFYHAKTSALIALHGPMMTFPWLDLTTLGTAYVDQHFLFHVAVIPFQAVFGMYWGAQVAAVLFGAGCLVVLYWLLKRLHTAWPFLWSMVLLFTPPFLQRLSLGKASPPAIALFMAVLTGIRLRWRWPLAGIGFLYALTHAGWPLAMVCAVLMIGGQAVFDRWIFETKLIECKAICLDQLRSFLFFIGGVLAGAIIHPNREHVLSFIWTQVFQIGVATPVDRVVMGGEWYGYDPIDLLKGVSLLVVGALFVVYGMLLARKKELRREDVLAGMSWGVAAGALFVLTLKSSRFAEYFVPLSVFALAHFASLIDTKAFLDQLKTSSKLIMSIVFALTTMTIGRGLLGVQHELNVYRKPFDRFDGAIAAIRSVTPSGERIFHSDWAHFPLLFAKAPEYRYVAGLDPTFLLSASSTLSDDYTQLTFGKTTTTLFDVVTKEFGAKTIFIEHKDLSDSFEEAVIDENRFEEVYRDDDSSVFRLKE